MQQKHYILGINASPRKNGNTETLMAKILAGAKAQGGTTETVHLRNLRIKQCLACEGCRVSRTCRLHIDDMQVLLVQLKAADGIVLGSPIHNYNISARMKIFIDRLYPFFSFNPENRREWHSLLPPRKKGLIYAVGENPNPKQAGVVLETMRLPLETLGCEITGEFIAAGFFEKQAVLKDEALLEQAHNAGVNLVKSLI